MMMVFFGLLLLVVFWGGLIFLGLWLVKTLFSSGQRSTTNQNQGFEQSAKRILDRRFARGEITREQYQLMKNDLE